MSRRRLFASLVCFVLAVTGCSGGSNGATKPKPTPLTVTQATAIAGAGVLVAADLFGYKSEAQKADPTDAADQAAFDRCLGLPVSTYLYEDQGKTYTKGELEIDSSASVLTTKAMATAEFAAADTAKGTDCLKAQAVTAVRRDVPGADVSLTTQSVTVPGADGVLFFDAVITGTQDGQQVEVHGNQAIVRVSQTEIELDAFATSPPLPTTDELVALLTKLVTRVKAAS